MAQTHLDADTNYRYVVGTKVVVEDVNHETVANKDGLYIGQDGVNEEVVHFIAELYNADTDALISTIDEETNLQ